MLGTKVRFRQETIIQIIGLTDCIKGLYCACYLRVGLGRCDLHEVMEAKQRRVRPSPDTEPAAIVSEFCTGFGSCTSGVTATPTPNKDAPALEPDPDVNDDEEDVEYKPPQATESLLGFGGFTLD